MKNKAILVSICLCLVLLPGRLWACAAHMGFNPDQFGPIGGAALRLAGLAPPKPVFELDHPATARSVLGENSEIVVNYSRPFFSSDVRIEVKGTGNIVLPQPSIPLDDREGTVTIPYQLVGAGYDAITLTVKGEHKGEMVQQVRRIYVRAKPSVPAQEQLVTSR